MINRFFFLFAALVFLVGSTASSVASGSFYTHTQHTPMELKPVSFSDMDNSYKTASVCFLGVGDCSSSGFGTGGDDYSIDTAQQCLNEGFVKLNCSSVQKIENVCSYNSAYGKSCVCVDNLVSCPTGQIGVGASCGGKYASCQCSPSLVSCASNKNGQGAYCGGKYQSCVCKPEYKFTSSNCTSPRSVSGSNCDGKYTSCSCPTGVSSGSFGCQEYYPSPCSSVCKIAKGDNCDSRQAVQTPYGCMSYFADCPSKCERAYPDNCRNRTAVTIPDNATCSSYFSDCSSKCKTWTCNSEYSQSGNSCIKDDPCANVSCTNGETCSNGSCICKSRRDCLGICGGSAVKDCAGICNGGHVSFAGGNCCPAGYKSFSTGLTPAHVCCPEGYVVYAGSVTCSLER